MSFSTRIGLSFVYSVRLLDHCGRGKGRRWLGRGLFLCWLYEHQILCSHNKTPTFCLVVDESEIDPSRGSLSHQFNLHPLPNQTIDQTKRVTIESTSFDYILSNKTLKWPISFLHIESSQKLVMIQPFSEFRNGSGNYCDVQPIKPSLP
jgi:hypothetical protein